MQFSRASYALLALATIVLGLVVHWNGAALGPVARDVLGDALWAAMIAWWVAVLVPAASIRNRAFVAVAICFVVETSQLYHTPALDAFRETTIGGLTLGSGFDRRDLVAYVLGVLAAVLFEFILRRRLGRTPHPSNG